MIERVCGRWTTALPQGSLHISAVVLLIVGSLVFHLSIGSELGFGRLLALVSGVEPDSFDDVRFLYSELPRLLLALMIGAAMGLCGSVMQQATQNRLASPLTIGTSSGAWLALVAATIWLPNQPEYSAWIATAGAIGALALVLLVTGFDRLASMHLILAGMAVHVLLSSIASSLVLLNDQATQSLFIWGAGDLTQTDWRWVNWLWPKLAIGLVLFVVAPRGLSLMRLGADNAAARGLPVAPFLALLFLLSLWMSASAIAAVGIIGFIALLSPNIARHCGATKPGEELVFSFLWGACLLVITDALALAASAWTVNLIPTGAAAALVGAPALILITARKMKASDHVRFSLPKGAPHLTPGRICLLLAMPASAIAAALFIGRLETGWVLDVPSDLVADLRWPRLVAAGAAGAGLAVSGVILQRLIRNPLASPEILGLTSGSVLALVGTALFLDESIAAVGPLIAVAGSGMVLALLIFIGRRQAYAPGSMVIVGISLAALADAVTQFALSLGDERAYTIVNWLSGSTYGVDGQGALLLLLAVATISFLALGLSRWLSLISIGDGVATARGLAVRPARLLLLLIACALAAAVTTLMGRVAFVGLIAPQLAALIGARNAGNQTTAAMAIGASLMIAADWFGRTAIYPFQLPAGAIASMFGGACFLIMLVRMR
jgi:ABC-type Fe3+-siderophore transport system permease subunit